MLRIACPIVLISMVVSVAAPGTTLPLVLPVYPDDDSTVEVVLADLLGEYPDTAGQRIAKWDAGVPFAEITSAYLQFEIHDYPGLACTNGIPPSCGGSFITAAVNGIRPSGSFSGGRQSSRILGDLTPLLVGKGEVVVDFGYVVRRWSDVRFQDISPGRVVDARLILRGIVVPEPSTAVLLIASLLGFGWRRPTTKA